MKKLLLVLAKFIKYF